MITRHFIAERARSDVIQLFRMLGDYSLPERSHLGERIGDGGCTQLEHCDNEKIKHIHKSQSSL